MSFAQEIKDFLSAAQSGQKLVSSMGDQQYKRAMTRYQTALADKTVQDMNDPLKDEQAKANIEATRARTAASRQSAALMGKRGAIYDAQLKAYNTPQEDPVAASIPGPASRPGLTPAPAIGGDQPPESTPMYAEGGMIDEDSDPDDEDDVAAPAIGAPSTDISARARTPISVEAAHDATAAGLKYGVQALGAQGGIPSPGRQQRMQALFRGAGAAPLADMNAIYKKIDPNNEMGESERNMSALSAVYQYKLRQGDPQGAQRAAFAMLQHYRMASQRYAAISAAAAAHGDIDGAAKAAMKAYANIPDGKDLKVQKSPDGQLSFTVTGPDGKVIHQGIASPQQLGAAALGVATKGFDQFLLDAAGQRAAKQPAGSGAPKGMKEPDKEKALSALDASYDKSFPAVDGKPAIGPDEERAIKGSAYRLYQSNPNITHDEAIDAVRRLMSPNAKNPKETGFTTKKLDDDQGYEVRIGKGAPIRMSNDDFDAMATARAEKMAALKKTKEAEEKKGPGVVKEAIGAIGDAYTRMRDKNAKDIKDAKISDDMAAERERYGDIRKNAEPDYAIPVTP
ncbi:hypothetical protein CWO91_16495 [Bradyrhizobium genosp. SA-3]|uniref:hypothetical protein n=1 Tax=Bradyrhizobium genosp. SA-3 TaxID=508868 RepID=UPI00102A92F9|nr:hypothetical protein [Bradyrhizobium genosp. SA-3]RZN09627.1 hypothetical protein CWO91_16495 [Bradyrhizobium genosp. SA-3]